MPYWLCMLLWVGMHTPGTGLIAHLHQPVGNLPLHMCAVAPVKPVSLPGLVNGCASADEILALARVGGALSLPGEERLHYETQLVHQRKRQRGAASALKRLSKMLIGVSPAAQQRRSEVLQSDELARYVLAALHPLPQDGALGTATLTVEDFCAYSEALQSLALLHTPAALLPIEAESRGRSLEACARLEAFLVGAGGNEVPAVEVDALHWAVLRLMGTDSGGMAQRIASARAGLHLPFTLFPDMVRGLTSIAEVTAQVPFTQSVLVTKDGKKVAERRKTCWMAEAGVGGLAYSGKIMAPVPFAPCIAAVRDAIEAQTGILYDCCLINLYEDGECACAYHVDPDLGTIFSRDSVIVSIGESRRFNLRKMLSKEGPKEQEPHVYHVHDGDVFYMFDDCQESFQHAILKSEGAQNDAARVSVVFKKTLPMVGGRRGHGLPYGPTPATAVSADKKKKRK